MTTLLTVAAVCQDQGSSWAAGVMGAVFFLAVAWVIVTVVKSGVDR